MWVFLAQPAREIEPSQHCFSRTTTVSIFLVDPGRPLVPSVSTEWLEGKARRAKKKDTNFMCYEDLRSAFLSFVCDFLFELQMEPQMEGAEPELRGRWVLLCQPCSHQQSQSWCSYGELPIGRLAKVTPEISCTSCSSNLMEFSGQANACDTIRLDDVDVCVCVFSGWWMVMVI